MKKLIAAICIAVTLIMAAALTVILVMGINTDNNTSNWRFGSVRIEAFNIGGSAVLVKEDSVSMDDITSLELLSDMSSVYISATDGDRMTVRQYSSSSLDPDEIFDLRKDGGRGHLTVDAKRRRIRIFVFNIFSDERIEVDIPRSWLGDVDMRGTSGGLKLRDGFEWGNISMKYSSGGITASKELKGANISVEVTSGGVNLADNITASGTVYIKSSSGGIKTEGITAKSADISCSSGGITVRGAVTADEVYMKTSSGGASARLINAGRFNIESSSGGIKIDELNGQGNVRCTSGGIRILLLNPTGNVELRASSGSIRADVPRDLKHYVSTSATSGSVTVNDR